MGAEPRTDWLNEEIACDNEGYIIIGSDLVNIGRESRRWPLRCPPMLLETSMPGVFAGDVRHSSVKRVASSVREGSTAIQLIHVYLN